MIYLKKKIKDSLYPSYGSKISNTQKNILYQNMKIYDDKKEENMI